MSNSHSNGVTNGYNGYNGNTSYPSWNTSDITFQTDTGSVDVSDLIALRPLLELVGTCVACGDDTEVLLCPPCGVAVRELGHSRLQKQMQEIREELS